MREEESISNQLRSISTWIAQAGNERPLHDRIEADAAVEVLERAERAVLQLAEENLWLKAMVERRGAALKTATDRVRNCEGEIMDLMVELRSRGANRSV